MTALSYFDLENWQRVKDLATAAASQCWAGDWAARIAEACSKL